MENNNQTQIELQRLQEIGVYLHQIRMEKRISLDAIAAKTLIPKRLLIAIENGDIDELPEPFYIKALIVKFARAIGAELPEFTLVPTKNTKTSPSSKTDVLKKHSTNFQLRSLHLYLFYILLVGISVRGIAGLVERPVIVEPTAKPDVPSDASVVNADSVRRESDRTVSPQLISQSSQSQSVTVGIDLEERCWLKVMVDGKKAFEGTLPKGTKRTWTGKEQVTIRAGNAGGVAVTFNNQKQQILGKPGQVQEVTYTVN